MATKKAEQPGSKSVSPFLLFGILILVAVAGRFYFAGSTISPDVESKAATQTEPSPAAATPAPAPSPGVSSPQPQSTTPPVEAEDITPAPFGELPPLPMLGTVPPRPMQTVRAVYEFAARRPDVLKYVPCFCGCEQSGHKHNEDCFVRARDDKGRIVAWDTHGMT